jgi:hypothetical protein
MIAPAYLAFELLFSLVFIACLVHAIRRNASAVMELVFAFFFGVLLEWMTIQQLQAYQYGQFLLMVDGAPLCIGMGWAVIIYSGMQLLESWEMPPFARPFAVGFYALHLDLAMDAIAIRQGFWHWVIPLDSQWHGVPWGNFWAWFIVVSSYSGLLYWLRARGCPQSKKVWLRWVYPLGALIGSVFILGVTNAFFANVLASSEFDSALGLSLLLLAGAVMVYVARPTVRPDQRPDYVLLAVPLLTHINTNIAGFAGGYYREIPVLMVVSLSMFAVGMGILLLPYWQKKPAT